MYKKKLLIKNANSLACLLLSIFMSELHAKGSRLIPQIADPNVASTMPDEEQSEYRAMQWAKEVYTRAEYEDASALMEDMLSGNENYTQAELHYMLRALCTQKTELYNEWKNIYPYTDNHEYKNSEWVKKNGTKGGLDTAHLNGMSDQLSSLHQSLYESSLHSDIVDRAIGDLMKNAYHAPVLYHAHPKRSMANESFFAEIPPDISPSR